MNWRLWGAVICGVLILLGVLSVVGFVSDPFGWRKNQLTEAKAQAVTATRQAELSGETVKIIDRTHLVTHTIRETADAESVAVRELGQVPLDPGLRERWVAGVQRVREASAGPDDPGSGEPSGELSAP